MKPLILAIALLTSSQAFSAEPYVTVNCATTSGAFSGSKTLATDRTTFSGEELKDILLGEKQAEDAPMPYPSDVVVAPKVRELQNVSLSLKEAPRGFAKAVYFTLQSENLADQSVFCTVSRVFAL